jgi:hypothetical protein
MKRLEVIYTCTGVISLVLVIVGVVGCFIGFDDSTHMYIAIPLLSLLLITGVLLVTSEVVK